MGSTGSTTRYSGGSTFSTSRVVPPAPTPTVTPVNAGNPGVQNQTPTAQNTPVTSNALNALTAMNDVQMAAQVIASRNVDMPNHLKDVRDVTQSFAFQIGLNEKPMVLDSASFAQFMKDNNIPQKEVIARTVSGTTYNNADGTKVSLSGNDINDILRYSRVNYIGGKHGGTAYGSGAYFEMNGGGSTGYGGGSSSSTMEGVLNPKTAKVIDKYTLQRKISAWSRSHPQTANAIGSVNNKNLSIYALCMGYNVISSGPSSVHGSYGDYYNVIDRSALVLKQ
jgi:hypothetical protein